MASVAACRVSSKPAASDTWWGKLIDVGGMLGVAAIEKSGEAWEEPAPPPATAPKNTFIWVLAGLAVAGILIYMVARKKP